MTLDMMYDKMRVIDHPPKDPMLPIQERNRSRTLWAFAAYDTVDTLIERAENLARSVRRMTKIRSYINNGQAFPDVKTGLTIDTDARDHGIRVWDGTDPGGCGITVLCNGVESWGFSACQSDGTEADVQARFQSAHPRNAARIVITGGHSPDSKDSGRDDRIEILEYNEHGVAIMTTIVFDTVTGKERAEHDAQIIEAMRGHAAPWDDQGLAELAKSLRDNWHTIEEEMALRSGGPST